MDDHDERHAGVAGHFFKKMPERDKAAGRCADADDRALRRHRRFRLLWFG